jgi:hypothetical protein
MDIPLRVESPMDKSARKIAYVLSMKEGLPSFNFREIEGVGHMGLRYISFQPRFHLVFTVQRILGMSTSPAS